MPYNNGIVTAPVNINDIRSAVSHSSGDIGTLIMNGSINKWAKYKPVRNPVVDTVTGQWDYNNNRWLNNASWWKAGGNCGFLIEQFTEFGASLTTPGTFMYKLMNQQLGWTYPRPQGGAQQPFRYQDFAQYNRNAIAPYGEIGATKIYVQPSGYAQIDWEITYVDDDNLRLTDFSISNHPLSDFYLGILLWSGNQWRVYTSNIKFGAGESLSIAISNATPLVGTWNMMPFFTLYQATSDTGFGANGLFISMADTTRYSIEFTRDGTVYFMMPWGQWNQAGTQVEYEIIIKNESANSFGFDSVNITIYGGSAQGTELGHAYIRNVVVPARNAISLTGFINAIKSGYVSYWINVSGGAGSTVQQKYSQVEDYGGMVD